MRNIKADLHNHLRTSSRMSGLVKPTIDKARKTLGPGGIIGLVNFDDSRYEDFANQRVNGYEHQDTAETLYFPNQDVLVVKGEEVQTAQGHLLVLGLPTGKHMISRRPLDDTILEAKERYDAITIADHPLYKEGCGVVLRFLPERYFSPDSQYKLDAVETHNGEAAFSCFGLLPRNANIRAQQMMNNLSLAKTDLSKVGEIYSSDGHSVYEIGSSWTELDIPEQVCITQDTSIVKQALKKAVQETNPFTPRKNTNSRFGAIDHISDLVTLIALGKIGIKI